jgi:hypothetical protein
MHLDRELRNAGPQRRIRKTSGFYIRAGFSPASRVQVA